LGEPLTSFGSGYPLHHLRGFRFAHPLGGSATIPLAARRNTNAPSFLFLYVKLFIYINIAAQYRPVAANNVNIVAQYRPVATNNVNIVAQHQPVMTNNVYIAAQCLYI
jgi:hypothetical protein